MKTPTGIRIEIDRLEKRFSTGLTPLDNVSLTIDAGSFVALLGPSGCGKTTLLRLIAELEKPTHGTLTLSPAQERPAQTTNLTATIAYVFQEAHLLPWRNVLNNVALPLELLGIKADTRLEKAKVALGRVGLGDSLDLYPNQLSGGMKMRVSLARALVTEPSLLLLDEPFAALDEVTRFRLDEDLRNLWASTGMTVVFVTHSITEAVYLSERVILFSRNARGVCADLPIALPKERNSALRADLQFGRTVEAIHRRFLDLEGETR